MREAVDLLLINYINEEFIDEQIPREPLKFVTKLILVLNYVPWEYESFVKKYSQQIDTLITRIDEEHNLELFDDHHFLFLFYKIPFLDLLFKNIKRVNPLNYTIKSFTLRKYLRGRKFFKKLKETEKRGYLYYKEKREAEKRTFMDFPSLSVLLASFSLIIFASCYIHGNVFLSKFNIDASFFFELEDYISAFGWEIFWNVIAIFSLCLILIYFGLYDHATESRDSTERELARKPDSIHPKIYFICLCSSFYSLSTTEIGSFSFLVNLAVISNFCALVMFRGISKIYTPSVHHYIFLTTFLYSIAGSYSTAIYKAEQYVQRENIPKYYMKAKESNVIKGKEHKENSLYLLNTIAITKKYHIAYNIKEETITITPHKNIAFIKSIKRTTSPLELKELNSFKKMVSHKLKEQYTSFFEYRATDHSVPQNTTKATDIADNKIQTNSSRKQVVDNDSTNQESQP